MKKSKSLKTSKIKKQELNWQMYLALTIVVLLATPVMTILQRNNDPLSQSYAASTAQPVPTSTPVIAQP